MILSLCSSDVREECDVIGGSPDQEIENCFVNGGTDDGCDGFADLDCTMTGSVLDTSPPDGQIQSAEECEDLAKIYQVN